MNKSKLLAVFYAATTQPIVLANVGYDALAHEPGDGSSMPDWASFLILLFVALMVFGKLK